MYCPGCLAEQEQIEHPDNAQMTGTGTALDVARVFRGKTDKR